MYLKPSEIFYSQDSINNVFDKRCNHRYKQIGETLDELCDGRSSVSQVPPITVVQKDGRWITADNRRLWVFKNLERLGKCDKIFVQKGFYIPEGKQTSLNGGASVRVRGPPGGYWHTKPSMTKPQSANVRNTITPKKTYSHSSYDGFDNNVIRIPPSYASSRGSANAPQSSTSSRNYNYGRLYNESSGSPSGSIMNNENIHHNTYRHKTYNESYTTGRQHNYDYGGTSKDNGCCIII